MAHIVLCPYCKIKFDRDKIKYVKVGKSRYAHEKCAIKDAIERSLPTPEVIDPTIIVKCKYCKKEINKNDKDVIKIGNNAYAHKSCEEEENKRDLTDAEKLDKYIMKLFGESYVNPRIQKQIKSYINDYNFSYSGILKALVYFYEIKGNPIEKANNAIGIVPFIYKDAYNYYYQMWLAKTLNNDKQIEQYIPQKRVIIISQPQKKIKKRQLFSFLDEECENNEQ